MSKGCAVVWVAPSAEVMEDDPQRSNICRGQADESVLNSLCTTLATASGDTVGIVWGPGLIRMGLLSWERLSSVRSDTDAGLIYGNYWSSIGEVELLPTYTGSLRAEFDTGPLWLVGKKHLASAVRDLPPNLTTLEAIRYGLRLGLMRRAGSVWIPEPLCSTTHARIDDIFGYVRTDALEKQREFESVLTDHLVKINALLPPRGKPYVDTTVYPVKATVVIPVRNRERTIKDAVRSALSQKTTFPFNVVVVDNHSTDVTGREARSAANGDERFQILTPPGEGFGIGGCWNLAARSSAAGRYLVQLDSDDVYASTEAVQTLINLIDQGPWAMAVGGYRTVDMNGIEVPPGDVVHAEWTERNGHNNLLRVSGVGAPRVLSTGFLRENPMPNVSYGEDYAVALRVSRTYRVARYFGVLYYARRWEGNTDHDVSATTARSRESYKDQLRTIELEARRALLRARDGHVE